MAADATPEMPLSGAAHSTALSRPYWEALHSSGFVLQRCQACGRRQHYPRVLCRHCGSTELEWAAASPAGVVVSAVLTHRTSKEELRPRLPYVIALVRMEDGPILLATLGSGSTLPPAGSRVEIDSAETLLSRVLTMTSSPTQRLEG